MPLLKFFQKPTDLNQTNPRLGNSTVGSCSSCYCHLPSYYASLLSRLPAGPPDGKRLSIFVSLFKLRKAGSIFSVRTPRATVFLHVIYIMNPMYFRGGSVNWNLIEICYVCSYLYMTRQKMLCPRTNRLAQLQKPQLYFCILWHALPPFPPELPQIKLEHVHIVSKLVLQL